MSKSNAYTGDTVLLFDAMKRLHVDVWGIPADEVYRFNGLKRGRERAEFTWSKLADYVGHNLDRVVSFEDGSQQNRITIDNQSFLESDLMAALTRKLMVDVVKAGAGQVTAFDDMRGDGRNILARDWLSRYATGRLSSDVVPTPKALARRDRWARAKGFEDRAPV